MSGFFGSQNVQLDPLAPVLQPVRNDASWFLQSYLQNGFPGMRSPYQGLISPVQQLYGYSPTYYSGGTGNTGSPTVPTDPNQPPPGQPYYPPPGPGNNPPGGNNTDNVGDPTHPPQTGNPNDQSNWDPMSATISNIQSMVNAAPTPSSGSRTAYSYTPQYMNQYTGAPAAAAVGNGGVPTGQNSATNFMGSSNYISDRPLNAFNYPAVPGPYAAPLTQGQMDALSGFQQLFDPTAVATNQDLSNAINRGLGGMPAFDPTQGQTLAQATAPYKLPSGLDSFMGSLFGSPGTQPGTPTNPTAWSPQQITPWQGQSITPQTWAVGPTYSDVNYNPPQWDTTVNNPNQNSQAQPVPYTPGTVVPPPTDQGSNTGPQIPTNNLGDILNTGDKPSSGYTQLPPPGPDSFGAQPYAYQPSTYVPMPTPTPTPMPVIPSLYTPPTSTGGGGLTGTVNFMAEGGQLDPSKVTVVGEHGPEAIVPDKGGAQVIPLSFADMIKYLKAGAQGRATGGQLDLGSTVAGVQPGGASGTAYTDALLPQITQAYSKALTPQSFNLTDTFKTAKDVYNADLQQQMAQVNEQASRFGLNPGSIDRNNQLLRTAGNLSSQYNLGLLGIANTAFENQQNRGLQALSMAPSIANTTDLPYQRMAAMAPLQWQMSQAPLQNMLSVTEPAATRAMQATSMLPSYYQIPYTNAQNYYNTGEQARQVAQSDMTGWLQNAMSQQGLGLNQLIALLSNTPLQNTVTTPSVVSQLAQLAAGVGSIIPG